MKNVRAVLLVAAAAGLLTGCATLSGAHADYDLKIVNGRIVDGTGAPWFEGDIGIRGDTIVAVGKLGDAPAKRTLDAHGRVVAPGFIDLLGQSQDAVLKDPHLEGKIRQGVTTEVTGEGFSPGPLNDALIAEAIAEDPDGAAPSWRTLGEYMATVEKKGSALNFAFFVGASNAREIVLGNVNRDPSEEELRRMEAIIDQAMREGAIGLSTSLIYVPATFSKTPELVRLAKVASRYGGVYFTHIRNEADEIDSALDEAFRIGEEAQIPVNIWHLKVGGRHNWGRMPAVLARIEARRAAGLDVAANVYPYSASSTGLTALAPTWALEGGYPAFLRRLKEPGMRAKILAEISEPSSSGFFNRVGGPSGVLVTQLQNPAFAQYQRKRLDEIAALMGVGPMEALLRLYESGTASPDAIYFSMSDEDMKAALAKPWVSVGADSAAVVGEARNRGAHPRAYGTFPRVVGRFVREDKLFSLEEAVRKVTSQAAARTHLWDRGVLRPGAKADVVVFDPATLRDVSTYDDPHHFSDGISDVVVNGVPVLVGGAMTDALPGRVLRGPGTQPQSARRQEAPVSSP